MKLTPSQVDEAAALLLDLRVRRTTTPALPDGLLPADLDDAYAIQDATHARAGWPISVLKVGCTSALAQGALGIPHPVGGRIPTDGVFESGATIERGVFANPPAIECEVAMRVGVDGSIEAIAPAMELIDPRVVTDGSFGGMTTVADNTAGCAVVIGRPTAIEPEEIGTIQVSLVDETGGEIATGATAAVIGGPAASAAWAIAHEAERGRPITPGTWIITGTCTGLTPTRPGGSDHADFGPLGSVSFTLGH